MRAAGMRAGRWALALGAAAVALAAAAADDVVAQREARMREMARALAPLIEMAQGKRPYDAALAAGSARGLAGLAGGDWAGLYPPGTDRASSGRGGALPAIWDDAGGFAASWRTLAQASDRLAAAADQGREQLAGEARAVGAACGDCHRRFRAPQ